uniref:Uncharacterized protein n=1 Tax=Corethron hystrix TaxID=216773 RepID=A0A7S1BEZ5_9STRA
MLEGYRDKFYQPVHHQHCQRQESHRTILFKEGDTTQLKDIVIDSWSSRHPVSKIPCQECGNHHRSNEKGEGGCVSDNGCEGDENPDHSTQCGSRAYNSVSLRI